MKAACEGMLSGFSAGGSVRQERAGKLIFLLPKMLLCRLRRERHVPKKECEQRLAMFNSDNWQELVSHSFRMSEQSFQVVFFCGTRLRKIRLNQRVKD